MCHNRKRPFSNRVMIILSTLSIRLCLNVLPVYSTEINTQYGCTGLLEVHFEATTH